MARRLLGPHDTLPCVLIFHFLLNKIVHNIFIFTTSCQKLLSTFLCSPAVTAICTLLPNKSSSCFTEMAPKQGNSGNSKHTQYSMKLKTILANIGMICAAKSCLAGHLQASSCNDSMKNTYSCYLWLHPGTETRT